MQVSILVDGEPETRIPVSDRGLQYGDGLFETLAVTDSRPRFWQRHMARLSRGEAALGFPPSDKALLQEEADRLCQGCSRGVLKLIITRGSGGRGYRPPESPDLRRILSLNPWPDYPDDWYRDGIRLRLCETRWSRNRRLAGIKHLNRLEQVLARQEWQDSRIVEGLMLDDEGLVISATQGNLLLYHAGTLLTPELNQSGIAGVMRQIVIETAEELAIPVRFGRIQFEEVLEAEALFVTNALLGLCPVAALDGRSYAAERRPHALIEAVASLLRQAA
jgi:4-amino-4-deoxychorismate lyase